MYIHESFIKIVLNLRIYFKYSQSLITINKRIKTIRLFYTHCTQRIGYAV